jgi:DNA-binding response OmpR family regulator
MYAPMKNKVLFVDDEEAVRQSWDRYLTQNGFNVVTAEDGKRAVNELTNDGVDVVVSDLRMPGIDGLELLAWVHDKKPDTRFILLTGYGNEEVERKARELGAFDYLNKPISPEALSAVITGALHLPKLADADKTKAAAAAVAPAEAPLPLEVVTVAPKKVKSAPKTFMQTVGGLILAPILGLAFVLFLPVIGFAMLFKVALEALRKRTAVAGS